MTAPQPALTPPPPRAACLHTDPELQSKYSALLSWQYAASIYVYQVGWRAGLVSWVDYKVDCRWGPAQLAHAQHVSVCGHGEGAGQGAAKNWPEMHSCTHASLHCS